MTIFDIFSKKDINREIEFFHEIPNAILLDVRSKEEYALGHIPGSINIPLDNISDIGKIIRDKNTPVFIYCLRGTRSLRAAGAMKGLGYTSVKSIGGIASFKGNIES